MDKRRILVLGIISVFILLIISLILSFYLVYQNNLDNIKHSDLIGGSENDLSRIVVVDNENNYVVAGWTDSTNFPSANTLPAENTNGTDVFLAKYDGDHKLLFSGIIGGYDVDQIRDIEIDSQNNIILVGDTSSPNIPVTQGMTELYDSSIERNDIFVIKLKPTLDFMWGTYIGGSNSEFAGGSFIDSEDNLYIAGYSNSNDFLPGKGLEQYHTAQEFDAVVVKLDNNGLILWRSFITGSDYDLGMDIVVDDQGFIYTVGYTLSQDLDIQFLQGFTRTGEREIFLSKLNQTGNLLWNRILGVNSRYSRDFEFEDRLIIKLDLNQDLLIAGWTKTENFLSSGKLNSLEMGDKQGFIMKLSSLGISEWVIFHGGREDEGIYDIVINDENEIFAVGETSSYDYPIINPLFYSYQGFGDAFIAGFNEDGEQFFGTFLGGSFWEIAINIEYLKNGNVIITGFTSSSDFYITTDQQVNGYTDTFILEIDLNGLERSIESKFLDTFENWLYIFIENTSIYEWIMITGAIVFSYRTLNYYMRTGIREYLLFAGIFISMALNSIVQALFILIGIAISSQSINFLRQPQIGLNITWILILYHSFRTKWTDPPKKLTYSFRLFFSLKLLSPLLIILGRQFDFSNNGFSILITVSYILFDIFVLIMLLYAYFGMDLVNPTRRVKRAYALWILAWILFAIGYILVIILVSSQIYLLSVGQDIESNLSVVVLYRTLNAFMTSGIYFFVVFIIIGIISIKYPEGVLLSHTQFSHAMMMYNVSESRSGSRNPFLNSEIKDDLLLYIEATKKIVEAEMNDT